MCLEAPLVTEPFRRTRKTTGYAGGFLLFCGSATHKAIRLWIGFIQRQPLINGGADYIALINCDKTVVVFAAAKALKVS